MTGGRRSIGLLAVVSLVLLLVRLLAILRLLAVLRLAVLGLVLLRGHRLCAVPRWGRGGRSRRGDGIAAVVAEPASSGESGATDGTVHLAALATLDCSCLSNLILILILLSIWPGRSQVGRVGIKIEITIKKRPIGADGAIIAAGE